MANTIQKKNWAARIAAVLLCLTIISIWLVCNMYARYTSSDLGSSDARIAAFIFEVQPGEISHYIDLEGIEKPEDTKTYDFIVKNQKVGLVSEVAETYTIQIQINGSMPLTCEVKKTDDFATVCSVSNIGGGNAGLVTNTSAAASFAAASGRNDQYRLTVEWPAGYKSAEFANSSGQGEVVLTVKGQQTD